MLKCLKFNNNDNGFFLFVLLSLIFAAISSINSVHSSDIKEKYVLANVYSKWSETPLLLEASEYVYKNNPSGFWRFVDEATKSGKFNSAESRNNESYYRDLIDLAAKYVTPMQLDLLKLALSIRTYSPAIEMSRKLAADLIDSAAADKCLTLVDIHGQITCDLSQIEKLIQTADLTKQPYLYQFDRHFKSNNHIVDDVNAAKNRIVIILYAQIGTADFARFHEKIEGLMMRPNLDYVLRHNYLQSELDELKNVMLSGYGVELDIKNVEYKAKDDSKVNAHEDDLNELPKAQSSDEEEPIQGFMFAKLKELNPQLKDQLDEYKKHLFESTLELAPLKAWQMQDLSLQAAQRILESDSNDVLNVLEDLAQNFPLRARTLSKTTVKADLKKAFKSQRSVLESKLGLEVGAGSLYLNGLELNMDTVDIFTLNALLVKESKLLEGLHKIGMDADQVKELIYMDTSSKNTDYGIDIRDTSVQWINDLELDSRYSYWSKSVQDILRPTYPGMLRSIAKNFFNLLFIIDPAKEDAKSLLKTAESFYVNEVPVRIGFAFITNNKKNADGFKEANVALYRAFNYVKLNTNSAAKGLSFITDVYAKAPKNEDVTADLVIKEFKRKYPKEASNLDDIFGEESEYDEGRLLTMEYYTKIGLRKLPQVLVNGFPLSATEIENDVFEESVITKIMQLTNEIQFSVYKGLLSDSNIVIDWLMSKEVIMPRLNARILSTENEHLQINDLDEQSRDFVLSKLKYLEQEKPKSKTLSDSSVHLLTLWIVCDPDTERGRQLLYDAIDYQESSKLSTRLTVLFKQSSDDDNEQKKKYENPDSNIMKKAIAYALSSMDKKRATLFIKTLLKEKSFNEIKSNKKRISGLDFKNTLFDDDQAIQDFNIDEILVSHNSFLNNHTPFKNPGNVGLIVNGRVLGPLNSDEVFIDSDFSLMENFVLRTGLKQLDESFSKWNPDKLKSKKYSFDDIIFMVHSMLGKYSSSDKRIKLPTFNTGFVNLKPKRPNAPYFDLVIVLDPLTRQAQKFSTILKVLTETTNINMFIYFNCKDKLSAPPLKSFYRYVLEGENRFKEGRLVKPMAYFHNMPQSPVLTMNIHSPESWMVEAVNSPYDLDNIILKEIDANGAYGEFELEHLVIEGHAYDVIGGQPPRGLQFNLGTSKNPYMYDTIVMANLGYFQLKASPGSWQLQLREGRSKEIYEIVSHENTDSDSKRSAIVHILVDSFESKVIKIKVSKKADKLNENLLDQKEDEKESGGGGIWSSINKIVGSADSDADSVTSNETKENVLNIFSVASGHLYERLMRIMMLTVLRNTKAKVKFWFLKNYLSPQQTKFLAYYAQKYNFEYELVQYKWPRWLHQQSEKQRIIWGYKILFLDVLFPLNVEKIIYVDADQIVRADLTELRDMNLKGAPYGYVPFCDSRKEMDGYRFWKSGYWAMHLGNRKYHISALYVVDLKKFRKIAAGDRLRGQYQGLSQDPNSLSNLDQDLPNNMIHQVNIFSLPQEWLYCDTWCSRDTLSKAKTIDLCNNPQTKEPKLEAAMRIVPEWKDYDNEIRQLMKEWQAEEKVRTTPTVSRFLPTFENENNIKKKEENKQHDHSDL